MSRHDRETETVNAAARRVMVHEGPAEIASWFFPLEEDEALRDELAVAIDDLLERRLAERDA